MVSRIMISLRRAADSQHENFSFGGLPVTRDETDVQTMEFVRPSKDEDLIDDDESIA